MYSGIRLHSKVQKSKTTPDLTFEQMQEIVPCDKKQGGVTFQTIDVGQWNPGVPANKRKMMGPVRPSVNPVVPPDGLPEDSSRDKEITPPEKQKVMKLRPRNVRR